MPKCEKCGTDFTYDASRSEVTSLRILCSPCERERRAAKAVVAGDPRSASARPAAPPPGPAVAPRPAPRAAPHPAPKAASAPAARAGAPGPPRPVPRVEDPAQQALQHVLEQKESDPVLLFGWIAAGVLVVVGGSVFYVVKTKKDREAAIAQAHRNEVSGFIQGLRNCNLDVEEDCQKAIDLAKSKESLWKDETIAADVTSIVARARANIDTAKQRRDLQERLANVRQKLTASDTLSPDELVDLRRKLDELELKGDLVGLEFVAALGATRNTAERVLAERLHAHAKEFAEANPDKGIAALANYKLAEDEVQKLLERAILANAREAQEFFQGHYQRIQEESNALCEAVFTAEVVQKTAWRDLLAADPTKDWNGTGMQGASWRIERGVLQIEGPPKEANKLAILTVGDREQWRDFALEMECTFESGKVELFVRLGRHADQRAENFTLAVGPDGFAPNQPTPVTVVCVGKKISLKVGDQEPYEIESPWRKSRKGSIGLVIPDGTKLKLTRMRIRVLR